MGFVYNILADIYNIQAVNYLNDFIAIGATLEEATWAQKNPKVFRVLHFMGKGHPTIPGVQVSRFGYRLHRNGDMAPGRQI